MKEIIRKFEEFKIIFTINFLKVHYKKKSYTNNIDFKDLQFFIDNKILYEKYHNLVNDLDIKSKKVVETLIFRNLLNKSFYSKKILSKKESDEYYRPFNFKINILELPFKSHERFYRSIYPGLESYEIPVFKYHHGLKFAGNLINDYLKGKDLIDGGAFDLSSTICLMSNYPIKRSFCFEISNEVIVKSLINLDENYQTLSKNIFIINEGLWHKKSKAIINEETKGGLAAYFKEIQIKDFNLHPDAINLNSIDYYINHSEKEFNIGIIKLDIEGSEYNAILGTRETIIKFQPILLIAIYHNYRDFFEIKPMIEKFAPGTYDFYIRKLAPNLNPLDTYLICIPKKLKIKIHDLEDIDIYG